MKKRIVTLSLLMSCCFILFLCSTKNSQAETYIPAGLDPNDDYGLSGYGYAEIADNNYCFRIYPQEGYAVFKYSHIAGTELIVPDSVEYKGKIYPVTSFATYLKKEFPLVQSYQTVILPDCVTNITFGDTWPNLVKFNIPKSIKSIQLIGVEQKVQYIVPDSLDNYVYKNNALYSKTNPQKLVYALNISEKYTVAEGTTELDHDCFRDTNSYRYIKEITLPKSVEKITSRVFSNCSELTKVDMSKTKVKVITSVSFCDTKKLKKLFLPKTLESIEKTAFVRSGISELPLSSKVKMIGVQAFRDCKALKSITIEGTKKMPVFQKGAFKNTRSGIKFYVKNQKMAKQLKKKLKKSGVKKAKIYAGNKKKLLYKNING